MTISHWYDESKAIVHWYDESMTIGHWYGASNGESKEIGQ